MSIDRNRSTGGRAKGHVGGNCPTPWKASHPDRVAALAARLDANQSAYRCPCGGWHVRSHTREGNRVR